MDKRGTDFATLVYKILVMEKQRRMEEVARDLGLKYDTLYARVAGRVPFSADEINALIRVIPDVRLINLLLDDTRFIAIDRHDMANIEPADEILRGATRSVLEVSDVLRAVEEGLRERRLDHRDRKAIEDEILEAEQALAALRQRLEAKT